MGGMHEFDERLVHRLEAADLERPVTMPPARDRRFAEEYCVGRTPPRVLQLPEVSARRRCRTACVRSGGLRDRPGGPDAGRRGGRRDGSRGPRVRGAAPPGPLSRAASGCGKPATGTLFSGDAVYRDGPLLDELPGSRRRRLRRDDAATASSCRDHRPRRSRPELRPRAACASSRYVARHSGWSRLGPHDAPTR